MDKTFVLKGKPESEWIVVDATGESLGRLATQIAGYLLGKHKPTFSPGVMMGDYVVVINAGKLEFTPERLVDKKYYHHSNYPGGLKTTSLAAMLKTHPDRVIRQAVWGMLPHNKYGRHILSRLKIYAESEHPHTAQNPQLAK